MKNVLFDLICAQPSVGSQFHGGGEYTKAIFEYLADNYHEKLINLSVMYDSERYIDPWIIDKINTYKIKKYDIKSEKNFCDEIDCSEIDIFYAGMSFEFNRDKLPHSTRCVTTIHDLRNFEEPVDDCAYLYFDKFGGKLKQVGKNIFINYLKNRNLEQYRRRINSFDEYICDSEHTKYMILAMLPEYSNRDNCVLYAPAKHNSAPSKPKDFNEDNYILLVSTNRWLKNSFRAIKAIDNLYERNVKIPPTVLVGGTSRTIKKKIKNINKFIFLDYLESSELEYVYSKCSVFLYPSLNEGFGLPPLEAMRYGKTCVVSGICSLPEIYGDSVYYINPYNIDEISGRIINALERPIERDIINTAYNRVLKRQDEDLKKICELIIKSK